MARSAAVPARGAGHAHPDGRRRRRALAPLGTAQAGGRSRGCRASPTTTPAPMCSRTQALGFRGLRLARAARPGGGAAARLCRSCWWLVVGGPAAERRPGGPARARRAHGEPSAHAIAQAGHGGGDPGAPSGRILGRQAGHDLRGAHLPRCARSPLRPGRGVRRASSGSIKRLFTAGEACRFAAGEPVRANPVNCGTAGRAARPRTRKAAAMTSSSCEITLPRAIWACSSVPRCAAATGRRGTRRTRARARSCSRRAATCSSRPTSCPPAIPTRPRELYLESAMRFERIVRDGGVDEWQALLQHRQRLLPRRATSAAAS